MEHFQVDGTTPLSWIIRVQAHNEGEVLEEAQRIARCRVDESNREWLAGVCPCL